MDLPEPLSPTTPNVSPLKRSMLTSSTALTTREFFPKPKKLFPPPNVFFMPFTFKTISSDIFLGCLGFKLGTALIRDLVYV